MTLWNTDENQYETFMPGEQLPDWAAVQVRNPGAFMSEEEENAKIFGRDIAIPGPSQQPFDVYPEYATKNRYQAASGAVPATGPLVGEPEFILVPAPYLRDEVIAGAGGDPIHPNEAQKLNAEVYNFRKLGDEEAESAENEVKDFELALKREAEEREAAAAIAREEYERYLHTQAQSMAIAANAGAVAVQQLEQSVGDANPEANASEDEHEVGVAKAEANKARRRTARSKVDAAPETEQAAKDAEYEADTARAKADKANDDKE
jgi:hypothetical protein